MALFGSPALKDRATVILPLRGEWRQSRGRGKKRKGFGVRPVSQRLTAQRAAEPREGDAGPAE